MWLQVTRALPKELNDDKRISLTCSLEGIVLTATPPDSTLYNCPASALVGFSVCDIVDVVDAWRQRSGSGSMQLCMLTLMDKESETPGKRVRWAAHLEVQGVGSRKSKRGVGQIRGK